MDNKTILELIKKNLEEINLLVDDLYKGKKYDQVLIEISIAKAKILYQELSLITPEVNSVIPPFNEEEGEEESEVKTVIQEVVAEEPVIVQEVTENIFEEPVINEEIDTENDTDVLAEIKEEIFSEVPEEFVHITIEESEQSIDMPDTDKLIDKVIEIIPDTNEKKVFGEKFSKEPSLNDRLSALHSTETKIKAKPIGSIKSAIGLNDRFLFIRELFNNDSSEFDASVERFDKMNSFLEVIEFLEQNYKWTKNSTSLKFMDLLKRRFEN